MLSMLSNLTILAYISRIENKLRIEEEPKLTVIKEIESVDTLKSSRALKLSLNKEVNVKNIILTRYKIKENFNEKFSYKKHCLEVISLNNIFIRRNNDELQEVLVKLGNININNKKEFNEKYRKKLDDEYLMSNIIRFCRLGKWRLLNTIKQYLVVFSNKRLLQIDSKRLQIDFERATYDELWENISSVDDESIILHFASLKTRIYKNFLMYSIIDIIDNLFDYVFESVTIVNDKEEILENKDCILYFLKEAIKRCKHKFDIRNKSYSIKYYALDNEKILNCIENELKDTLNKQYPSEIGVAMKYTCYKELTNVHSSNIIFEQIKSRLFSDYFDQIGVFIFHADAEFQECIETIQTWLIKDISNIKIDLKRYNDISDYIFYLSLRLEFLNKCANTSPEHKEIYDECINNQTKILDQALALQFENEQIKIFDSLVNDNVAFKISFLSEEPKTQLVETKYYRFVSLTEIEEISKDKLHIRQGLVLTSFFVFIIIFIIVLMIGIIWLCFSVYKIKRDARRR